VRCPNCFSEELIKKEEKYLLKGVTKIIELKVRLIYCPECGYENKRVLA
jgi:YgiT-type zinc finger domain-containing protein